MNQLFADKNRKWVWVERMKAFLEYAMQLNEVGWPKAEKLLHYIHQLMRAHTALLLQEQDAVAAGIVWAFPELRSKGYLRIATFHSYLQSKEIQLQTIGPELQKLLGVSASEAVFLPIQTHHTTYLGILILDAPTVAEDNYSDPGFATLTLCFQAQLKEILELADTVRSHEKGRNQFYMLTQHISQGFIFIDDYSPTAYVNEAAAYWLQVTPGENSAEQVSQGMNRLRVTASNQHEINEQMQQILANPNVPVKHWLWKYFDPELLILKVSGVHIVTPELQGKLWLLDEITREIAMSEEIATMNEELATSNEELITVNESLDSLNKILEDRNHFIELVLETVPDSILIFDIALHQYVYASNNLFTTLGLTEGWGRAISPELWRLLLYVEDVPMYTKFQAGFLDDYAEQEMVFRLRHANGSYRWFLAHGAVFGRSDSGKPLQIIFSLQDISLLKATEHNLRETLQQLQLSNAQLQESNDQLVALTEQLKQANREIGKLAKEKIQLAERQYQDLTHHMKDSFIIFDRDLHITYSNKAAENLTHLPQADLVGKRVEEILPATLAAQITDDMKTVLETENSLANRYTFRQHDNQVYIESNFYPTSRKGVFAIVRDITAQVLSEFHFKDIAESITDPLIILDEHFRYVYWNAATEKATRKSFSEAIGKTPEEALGSDYYQQYKDRFDAYKRVMETQVPELVSHTLIRDDKLMYIEITVYPTLQGGVLAITRNVTARTIAEKNYSELANSITDIFFALNTDLEYVFFNKACEEFMGRRAEEVLGKTIYEIIPFIRGTETEQMILKVLKEKVPNTLINSNSRAGRVMYYRMYFYPTASGVSVFAQDITERREYQLRIEQLNEELEQKVKERTDQLIVTNKELETFSYSVSHDLRAPLRSIDGFSKALWDDYGSSLNEEGRDYIATIRKSVSKMAQLIETIMKLARVTRTEVDKDWVNLSQIAGTILTELHNAEPARHVVVFIEPDMVVLGDEKLLIIALQNLLHNAWKYSSKREEASIEVGKQTEGEREVYFVRDNGVGFDMKYADKLFTPFQRMHSKRDFEGTGIGLATVQRIVAKHGGRIWVETALNQGAVFYFTLK